ncbi:hypothetical protein [Palaeococcus ferrophilus]|uniref:hypothetical protein n=1 Tax=Palaeococcus ferrophilus TaxID=83868 RepID=UPI00064E3104|nr:hypothetical protein [Palaeococcus ferrophilus]
MVTIEALLLVWGVRDEDLERLPVDGYWLYGEYDFIGKIYAESEEEFEALKRQIARIVGHNFKIFPVKYSATSPSGPVFGEKVEVSAYL